MPNADYLSKYLETIVGSLSTRVWDLSQQAKTEMTDALLLGIMNGEGAPVIARKIKRYLNNPDALFRRVRDASGNLIPSKKMAAYHPGQGVYKSAYKNAVRNARALTNQAYLIADHYRWIDDPTIVGIRIELSDQHPDYKYVEICEELQGDYPKQFLFPGWHTQCLCHVTPILVDKDAFRKWLRGEGPKPEAGLMEIPDNFKKYLLSNFDKLSGGKSIPFWMLNNRSLIAAVLNEGEIKAAMEVNYNYFIEKIAEQKNVSNIELLVANMGFDEFAHGVTDPILLREIMIEISRLKNRYQNSLWDITTLAESEKLYARAGSRVLELNPIYFGNKEKFLAELANDVKTGFHPVGCDTIKAVIDHEFAHVITLGELNVMKLPTAAEKAALAPNSRTVMFWNETNSVRSAYHNDIADIKGRINSYFDEIGKNYDLYMDNKVAMDAFKYWNNNNLDDLRTLLRDNPMEEFQGMINLVKQYQNKFISDYAADSIEEFVAEGFSMAMNNPEPSMYAQKIYNIINKYFGLP